MLTPFDKQRRLQTSKDFLELVGDNIDEICDRIVTVVKPGFVNTIRNLNRSPCNGRKGAAEEIQGSKSASKLMATIFGIVKAREAVVQKRRGKLSRGVLFLRDNASVNTARISRQALKDTGFSEIEHPPYSPDLAPSDYFLFSNLKKELRGRRFVDDNQMKMAVESHFDCTEKEYFWARTLSREAFDGCRFSNPIQEYNEVVLANGPVGCVRVARPPDGRQFVLLDRLENYCIPTHFSCSNDRLKRLCYVAAFVKKPSRVFSLRSSDIKPSAPTRCESKAAKIRCHRCDRTVQRTILCRCEVSHDSVAMAWNRNAGGKEEGPGTVEPAHRIYSERQSFMRCTVVSDGSAALNH
ncbi:Mariner Mos1 transposase [Eumeta japonica]|uniref:Mariner Mos1 transposase n=1 Tax=Eumeta variegata TaxID=151549 RepID=A0A4C1TI80_EUMVA|nr:Mariner Mos1 transposase [Eumeta japonica]